MGILVSQRSCGGKALGIGLSSLIALTSLIWGAFMSLKIDTIDNMLLRICYWWKTRVWDMGAPGATISIFMVIGILIINSVGLTIK